VVTTPADTINISIKANGSLFIDQAEVSQNELETVFSKAAAASKKTPVHLRAEKDTRYEDVLNVMSLANRMGLSQIGFVTQAERSPAAAR
jgi:biopolymer transport protein ExbD